MSQDTFGCVGHTIRLRGGGYFDFADPQPDQFTLLDIAGALSKICRFGGQVDYFYSVAEHSFNCSRLARRDGRSNHTQAAALLHDAAEAFTGDCVKPLKLMLREFVEIENRVEAAIFSKFGIDFERERAVVKEIDNAMLIAEKKHLFSSDACQWEGENDIRHFSVRINCWTPSVAEESFLNEAERLGLHP